MAEEGTVIDEVRDLKKEIIDARSLTIKTDNLVKNLSADIKQMHKRLDAVQKRTLVSSIGAYLIFACLVTAGAWMATSQYKQTLEDIQKEAVERAEALEARAEKAQREARETEYARKKALDAWNALRPGNLEAGLTAAAAVDRERLTPLELTALEEKEARLRLAAAQESSEAGFEQFKAERWTEAIALFDRTLELAPAEVELRATTYYRRGYAHFKERNYEQAAPDFAKLLEARPDDNVADDSLYFLAYALEKTDRFERSAEAYERLIKDYSGSPYVKIARNRLRGVKSNIQKEEAAQQQ